MGKQSIVPENGIIPAFGSLNDIRIIDLTQMLAGPFGTMMMADHGATVIKVEPPEGDTARLSGLYRADDELHALDGYFQSVNRNKSSVVLDLKSSEGKNAFFRLVEGADAVIENFRAGVMDRLGLGYESLREINPRLVYGCLRGFGDPRTGESPYCSWPAFDVVAQAMGGVMAITGPDADTPLKIGPGIGDIIPGMFLAFGVIAAIHHARRTGIGQFVDVGMTDSIFAICERAVVQRSILGVTPAPEGNHHPFLCPFGLFPASDGPVAIAATKDHFFRPLCTILGAPEILEDERFSTYQLRSRNRLALIEKLEEVTARFSKADLMRLIGNRIPFGPVMNVSDALDDPHFAIRNMIVDIEQPGSSPISVAGVPIKMTETPGGVHRRSPLLGEHNHQYLPGTESGIKQKAQHR